MGLGNTSDAFANRLALMTGISGRNSRVIFQASRWTKELLGKWSIPVMIYTFPVVPLPSSESV
jgi:hypothetical protein